MKLFGKGINIEKTGIKPSTVIKLVALALATFVAVGFIFMNLWNWLMPEVFGLGEITLLQGFGILFLAKMLFSFDNTVNVNKNKSNKEVKEVTTTEANITSNDEADEMYEKWWTEEGEAYFEDYLTKKTLES